VRSHFFGYYPFTPDQFAQLWRDCLFVFDSSVLLNLYEYRTDARDELLNLLAGDKLKDRLWLPHQVGVEFFRNRLTTIHKQRSRYKPVKNDLAKVLSPLESEREHPHVSAELLQRFQQLAKELGQELERAAEKTPHGPEDPVLPKLLDIFDKRVGDYDESVSKRVKNEGSARYASKTPPGYEDAQKPEHERYGDLVIWFQILAKAAAHDGQPMILVTSDEKEDWFQKFGGKDGEQVGPQPQLLAEFHKATDGKLFYLYSFEDFLRRVNEYLKEKVSDKTIKHVRAVDEAKATENVGVSATLLWNLSDREKSEQQRILTEIGKLSVSFRADLVTLEMEQPVPHERIQSLLGATGGRLFELGQLLGLNGGNMGPFLEIAGAMQLLARAQLSDVQGYILHAARQQWEKLERALP